MLFHLLKFMVAECGCNRAHRALKGDIFAEALQFPINHHAFALRGSRARALSRHYEGSRGKREAKWFPGFYSNLQSQGQEEVGAWSQVDVSNVKRLGCGKPKGTGARQ